jgi:hypothetical protein
MFDIDKILGKRTVVKKGRDPFNNIFGLEKKQSPKSPVNPNVISLFKGKGNPMLGDRVTKPQRQAMRKSPWADWDSDGVINGLDCAPKNSNKHGLILGKNFPAQIHLGSIQETPKRIEVEFNSNRRFLARNKPQGGFWTSSQLNPHKNKFISKWEEWTSSEMPHAKGDHILQLRATNDARIFSIKDRNDRIELEKKYSFEPGDTDIKKPIDWKKFSKDYDALHITEQQARQSHKFETPKTPEQNSMPFYSYDSESTVWLRPKFKKSKVLGTVKEYENKYDDSWDSDFEEREPTREYNKVEDD